MNDGEMLTRALFTATLVYENKINDFGDPHILHSLAVASRCKSIKAKTIAFLRGSMEDSSLTVEKLKEIGFPKEITEAVDALTRRPNEEYFSGFIMRIAVSGPLAIEVKLADLAERMRPELSAMESNSSVSRKESAARMLMAASLLSQSKHVPICK